MKIPFASPAAVAELRTVLYPPIFNGSFVYTSEIGREAAMFADFYIVYIVVFLNEAFKSEPYHSYLFSIGEGLHGEDVPYTFFQRGRFNA
jgi:hypothetical protein